MIRNFLTVAARTFRRNKAISFIHVLGLSIGIRYPETDFRKILTVSQFVVAQFFIIATCIVAKQIHFSLTQDLGYRKEAIITFATPRDTVADHREQIRNEIESIPEVQLVSLGFLAPAIEGAAFGNIAYMKENGEKVKVNVQVPWGDPNYIKVYKIGLVAGRNIRGGKNIDEVLINETYARSLGFQDPRQALQRELLMGDGGKSRIVGVMRDFHEGSLRGYIGPLVFMSSDDGNFFHVAFTTENGASWQTRSEKLKAQFQGFIRNRHSITHSSTIQLQSFMSPNKGCRGC